MKEIIIISSSQVHYESDVKEMQQQGWKLKHITPVKKETVSYEYVYERESNG